MGCASKQPAPPVVKPVDPILLKLTESADRVAQAAAQSALIQSAALSKTRRTSPYAFDLKKLPKELREPLRLEQPYFGELSKFLESIAVTIDYDLREMGKKPSLPILITMNDVSKPVAEIVADAGFQGNTRALVTLEPRKRLIVIEYSGH